MSISIEAQRREGVPVRDIAELLDVSPQRVSQIANSSYEK
jgi:Mn-dependent DtxR family transcriptional regulator